MSQYDNTDRRFRFIDACYEFIKNNGLKSEFNTFIHDKFIEHLHSEFNSLTINCPSCYIDELTNNYDEIKDNYLSENDTKAQLKKFLDKDDNFQELVIQFAIYKMKGELIDE